MQRNATEANELPKPVQVLLVTSQDFPCLTSDDQILLRALSEMGISAAAAVWDDPNVDWGGAKIAVLRSTWDYFTRFDEFRRWFDHAQKQVPFANTASLIQWNWHKAYLFELEAKGVRIVPSVLIRRGQPVKYKSVIDSNGWSDVVVKPTVSGSAYLAKRMVGANETDGEDHLNRVLAEHDALIQPYIAAVETSGERSFVFLGGVLSHVIRKAAFSAGAAGGDSDEVVAVYTKSEEEFACSVLACLEVRTDYARVDIVTDAAGPMLMELELIEPALHFRLSAGSAERFATVLARHLR